MDKDIAGTLQKQVEAESKSALDDILREGARRMLQAAVEAEVADYVEQHTALSDPATGRRLVVRNGHQPERTIQSSLGDIPVCKPRVHDRREGERFTSSILPPYLRRTPALEALIPLLYLKGVSTNAFPEALSAILGENASGLSASTISRLKEVWQGEHEQWARRDLSTKRYVYWWADGIYFTVRLTPERPCLLVIVGTLEDGTKELVAIQDGERESRLSWRELLRDLKRRGLAEGPALCVADGALGLWSALEEEFPKTREQRCWVHKTANVLDKMPKGVQASAKRLLHEMYLSATKAEALEAYREFQTLYGAKYPKACQCLEKDTEVLFTFYDFPAEHWRHLRTTNVVESPFAGLRLRTNAAKRFKKVENATAVIWKMLLLAEQRFHRLDAPEKLMQVYLEFGFQEKGEETETKREEVLALA